MPVTCRQISGKWYIVSGSGTIEKTDKGNPRGVHESREACMAQARAINASLTREGKINEDGNYEP